MIPDLPDVTSDLYPEMMVIVGVLLQLGADGAPVLAAPIAAEVNAAPAVASRKALGGKLSMTFIAAEVHGEATIGDAPPARASYFHRLRLQSHDELRHRRRLLSELSE
jgi:hypothetical protein